MELANEFLKAPKARFDLDQDSSKRTVQAHINRPPTGTWDCGLDRCPPVPIARAKQVLDDPGLGGIPDQRPRSLECSEPQVGPQDCGHSKPRSKGNTRIALLEPADHGSARSDCRGDRCLRGTRSNPHRSKLLGQPR
jgi:hypothetical protein